jgi:hypothetical protein
MPEVSTPITPQEADAANEAFFSVVLKASRGINAKLTDLVCKGNLLPTPGENDHVDQDHDGFGGRCHRMRVSRARWRQWQSRQRVHVQVRSVLHTAI